MSDAVFPIISVVDLAVARAFYLALGFTPTYQFPAQGEPRFLTMERDGATIGIGGGGDREDRFALWVYVEDVDAAVAAMRADGAVVESGASSQEWGERVASLRDPDGNLIYLGARS